MRIFLQFNLFRIGQSDIGARLSKLDNARSNQQSLDLISQGLLSNTRDLDYTEAVSRLSFQTFVLEAAQQSFVKVANLSPCLTSYGQLVNLLNTHQNYS